MAFAAVAADEDDAVDATDAVALALAARWCTKVWWVRLVGHDRLV